MAAPTGRSRVRQSTHPLLPRACRVGHPVRRHSKIVRALTRPALANAGYSSEARGTGRGAVPRH